MAYASHRLELDAAKRYPALGELLQPDDAQALADIICDATGAKRVVVIGNLKTQRRVVAWYECSEVPVIRHCTSVVNAKVLLHELAHHLVMTNFYWGAHRFKSDITWHGREFAGVVWALYEQWVGAPLNKPKDYHMGAYRHYSNLLA